MNIRSLPVRFHPIEGEAIDSFVECFAARLGIQFGEFTAAIGLKATLNNWLDRWIVRIDDPQLEAMSRATGIPNDRLQAMTLSSRDGRGVQLNSSGAGLDPRYPWGLARASRFCPLCLDASDGRWQLKWRLNWSFACIAHACLLVDTCPTCGARQRLCIHPANRVPEPGMCAHRAMESTHTARRCGSDLRVAPTTVLEPTHPAIVAQKIVYEVLDEELPHFGIYAGTTETVVGVLADIRAIARCALIEQAPHVLASLVPSDVVGQFGMDRGSYRLAGEAKSAWLQSESAVYRAGHSVAPRAAATVALGVSVACKVLAAHEVQTCADMLTPLVMGSSRTIEKRRLARIVRSTQVTQTLDAICRAARAPALAPIENLRQRSYTTPRAPNAAFPCGCEDFDRRVPTMMWEQFALRIPTAEHRMGTLRQVLSIAVVVVGTMLTISEVKLRLRSAVGLTTINQTLKSLQNSEWKSIAVALERLSDQVFGQAVVIDYRRRREIDYSTFLPRHVWDDLCLAHGLPDIRRHWRLARIDCVERLSGAPAKERRGQRPGLLVLARLQTIEFATELEQVCRKFLNERGVVGEPTVWCPDLDVLSGLELPNSDPADIDIRLLHHIIRDEGLSVTDAAGVLGTSVEAVRHRLLTDPVGVIATDDRTARTRFPHVDDGLTSLVADDLRTSSERDWLHEEYVRQRRTPEMIASRSDMSRYQVYSRLVKLDVPMRRRGIHGHRWLLEAMNVGSDAPATLRNVVLKPGGWRRLQRFADCADYCTIEEAASALGYQPRSMTRFIRRLETELDFRLLMRLPQSTEIVLTDDGRRLVDAIHDFRTSIGDRGDAR